MQIPHAFEQRTQDIISPEEYARFKAALQSDSPVSIRYNPLKVTAPRSLEQVGWSDLGFYLPQRLTYTFDPLFHAGCYYVQEASSMFLEQVLKRYVTEPVRFLDLCAAPGGKTTHAVSLLPEGSLIVSNEKIRNRANVLAENVIKWGHPNCVVTHNDVAAFTRLTDYFDVILTDVPCSGEGMFRKDADAVCEWSVENVAVCAERQRSILQDIWPALRPGGLLIYSTCTYNRDENEWMIEYLQQSTGAELLPVPVDSGWGIKQGLTGEESVYRFMPHCTRGEGFFMAVLRKPEEECYDRERLISDSLKKYSKKDAGRNRGEQPKKFPQPLKSWLLNTGEYLFETKGDDLVAYPQLHRRDIALLQSIGTVLHAGIPLGMIKGADIVPDHALAMSVQLDRSLFNVCEVDLYTAIAYLRREAVQLPVQERGYILLTYKNKPLGWVKNIGNRANNLYPQEWRIRSGYTPEKLLTMDF